MFGVSNIAKLSGEALAVLYCSHEVFTPHGDTVCPLGAAFLMFCGKGYGDGIVLPLSEITRTLQSQQMRELFSVNSCIPFRGSANFVVATVLPILGM